MKCIKTIRSALGFALLLLLCAIAFAARGQNTQFYTNLFGDPVLASRYAGFMKDADEFDKKLSGCPMTGFVTTDKKGNLLYALPKCELGKGYFDAALWRRLEEEAPKVFRKPQ